MLPACRRANASQYLVKTGMGCNGISVVKRTLHMPFQTVSIAAAYALPDGEHIYSCCCW